MNKHTHKLLLSNIKQLLTLQSQQNYLKLQQSNHLQVFHNYSVLVDTNGLIDQVGTKDQIAQIIQKNNYHIQSIKDCTNLIAIPGLVDCHTHTLYAGDRSKQFDMKLNGKNYVDIYNQGLGIRYTTQRINQSPIQDLVQHLKKYLNKINKLGTTTIQIKSGYGLNAQAQVKMLKSIEITKMKFKGKIDVISTFCGAHAIPKGKTEQQQTLDVINNQIPAVKSAMQKGQINPTFIDVFCQRKFFQAESSKAIMQAGKKIGLIPSFHGDQLSNLQSGSIAAEVGAKAVSHLEYISQDSIKKMAQNNIVGVLLPTTQNIQKLPIPPIKIMREHNMIVALGSDFCPNAFCYNMSLVCHLACVNYRLTPKQALAAATLNSAYALGLNDRGSIVKGKKADILLLEAETWTHLMYQFGDTPINSVIKQGLILNF